MAIFSRSLALAGGTALLAGVLGAGVAIGSGASLRPQAPGSPASLAATAPAAADPTIDAVLAALDGAGATGSAGFAAPGAGAKPAVGPGERILRLARWKQLVHATLTVDRPGAGIQTFTLDHGTISGLSSGSIVVAEAGGSSVTLATDARTRVRKDAEKATLADLVTGDRVVVVSVAESGGARALLVVVPPVAGATPQG